MMTTTVFSVNIIKEKVLWVVKVNLISAIYLKNPSKVTGKFANTSSSPYDCANGKTYAFL